MYYGAYYSHRYPCYRDYHRHCDDLILYELIRQRDRERDRLRDKLYEVDPCNPYYGDLLCRYRR